MEKVALLVSCCVVLAHVLGSQAEYSFLSYTQQCPTGRGTTFPSATYNQQRHLNARVEDSLFLHRGVLIQSGQTVRHKTCLQCYNHGVLFFVVCRFFQLQDSF